MSSRTFTLCNLIFVVGLVSGCGSDGDTTTPVTTQGAVETGLPSNDDTADAGNAEESGAGEDGNPTESDPVVESDPVSDPVDSNPAEPDNDQTGEGATQDADQTSAESESNTANPQNDAQQTNTGSQQQPTAEAEAPASVPPAAVTQRVNFGAAKLVVDLVPNGGSHPDKFHLAGDKLYFTTASTDPRFAGCASHWGQLNEEHLKIGLNLVAANPETGAVTMNKKIMTVGDFADGGPNSACAGSNGTIMDVYQQHWITPGSSNAEQKFVLSFGSYGLGPDRSWVTDGSDSNTRQLATSELVEEQVYLEGDKMFFVNEDGLSVADSFAGDRRRLFEAGENFGRISRIVRSPARQATFEINVGQNRTQIWTYDLDTDEWEKKFSLKPNGNAYTHYETLLVDGQILLSEGWDSIERASILGVGSNYGDVTSFEILTNSFHTIVDRYPAGAHFNQYGVPQVLYTTIDYGDEGSTTSVWRYSRDRIEKLFSTSDGYETIIPGHDGRIYITATKRVRNNQENNRLIELWSYDTQTDQLVKLSNDGWYAKHHNFPMGDEYYQFRYLSTPDGLLFVNTTENSGRELWFTDGTREGSRQLADINPGNGSSDPRNFYYSGDAIYFSANDGTHGQEPWKIPINR